MSWLTNIIRPKIRAQQEQKEVPDNLWQKCPACEGMLFHRDLTANLNVCYHCGYHMKIAVMERLALLFDDGRFKEVGASKVPFDPLKFKDTKKYADRLKAARAATERQDAIVVARGTMGGIPTVIAAFDFAFMGGSMGAAVGEGIVIAAEHAVKDKAALIVIPASGGARMQEGSRVPDADAAHHCRGQPGEGSGPALYRAADRPDDRRASAPPSPWLATFTSPNPAR